MSPRNSTILVLLRSCWAHSHRQTLDLFPVKCSAVLHIQLFSSSSSALPALTPISACLTTLKHTWALSHGSASLPQPTSFCKVTAEPQCHGLSWLIVQLWSSYSLLLRPEQGWLYQCYLTHHTNHGSTSSPSRGLTLPGSCCPACPGRPSNCCLHAHNPPPSASLYRLTFVYICKSCGSRASSAFLRAVALSGTWSPGHSTESSVGDRPMAATPCSAVPHVAEGLSATSWAQAVASIH